MTTPPDLKPTEAEPPKTHLTAGGDLNIGEYVGRDKTTTTTYIGTLLQNIQTIIPLPAPLLIGVAIILALGLVSAAFILRFPALLSPAAPEPSPALSSSPPAVTAQAFITPAVSPLPTLTPTPTRASPTAILARDHPGLECIGEGNTRAIVYETASQTLWAASEAGLLRIEHVDNQWDWRCGTLPDGFVVEALAALPDGLWVGGPAGLGFLNAQGEFQKTYTTEDGLFADAVTSLVVAQNGWVWAGHYSVLAAGVSGFNPETQTWHALPYSAEPRAFNRAYALAVGSADERVWVATGKGLYSVTPAGQWAVYRTEDSPPPPAFWLPDNAVSALLMTNDSCLWVGTGRGTAILGEGKACLVEQGDWQEVLPPELGIGWEAPSAIQADTQNTVWLATQNGVWSVRPARDGLTSRLELARGHDLLVESIFALAIDEEGEPPSLWIGTDRGLYYWPRP